MVCLVETLDERMLRLEQRMIEVEAKVISNHLRLDNERQYVDKTFGEVNKTLTSLTCHMKIVEEIAKNWNVCSKSSIQSRWR